MRNRWLRRNKLTPQQIEWLRESGDAVLLVDWDQNPFVVLGSTDQPRINPTRAMKLPIKSRCGSVSVMATLLTSLNRKGGVGKTHLCWLVASVAQERGLQTLLVDLDPQANLTSSFLPHVSNTSVEVLFDRSVEPDLKSLIQNTKYHGVDVVPSSERLEPFNEPNPQSWWDGDLQFSLAEAVEAVRDEYDFILFDCPPSLSLVSYAAMCASDHVMIPLEAARWGALGTQHIVTAMEEVQQRFNSKLSLLGYVVSRYKARRAYQQQYLAELRKHFEQDAFDTVIPDLAAFEKSVTDQIPITSHSPTSHASRIARRFFDELIERCERLQSSSQPNGRSSLPASSASAA